jgi:ABC-type antimicrobial peptide transport system permease subunit
VRLPIALIFRYSLRSLRVRLVEAVLSLLGLALTAAVVVLVAALDQGIQDAFATSGSDDVVIVQRRGAESEVQGWLDGETATLVGTLEGLAGPASREVVVSRTFERRGSARRANVLVRGLEPAGYGLRRGFKLVQGRLPSGRDAEVIAGSRSSERYVGLGVGESFTVGKLTFRVVGAFEAGGPIDNEVWGASVDVQAAFMRHDTFTCVRARLAGESAEERSAALARLEQAIASDPRNPVHLTRESDYYALQEASAAEIPKLLGRALAIFLGLGAGLASMNTMYARIGARAREIGTLRALGYPKAAIVVAFVAESTFLGLLGGAIGVLLSLPAHGFSSTATPLTNFSEVTFRLAITRGGIVAALVLSALVGALGGLLPARHAACMEIQRALRDG